MSLPPSERRGGSDSYWPKYVWCLLFFFVAGTVVVTDAVPARGADNFRIVDHTDTSSQKRTPTLHFDSGAIAGFASSLEYFYQLRRLSFAFLEAGGTGRVPGESSIDQAQAKMPWLKAVGNEHFFTGRIDRLRAAFRHLDLYLIRKKEVYGPGHIVRILLKDLQCCGGASYWLEASVPEVPEKMGGGLGMALPRGRPRPVIFDPSKAPELSGDVKERVMAAFRGGESSVSLPDELTFQKAYKLGSKPDAGITGRWVVVVRQREGKQGREDLTTKHPFLVELRGKTIHLVRYLIRGERTSWGFGLNYRIDLEGDGLADLMMTNADETTSTKRLLYIRDLSTRLVVYDAAPV